MKPIIFIFVALVLSEFSFGQTKQHAWVRFLDTTSDLYGYKDLSGKVRISPGFAILAPADTFYQIIAVGELQGKNYSTYYLLKDGRKIARDSVYVFDFSFDCESEGKIIFEDRKKDRVGFLNSDGEVIIPAMYNWVSSFHNGLALALRNAKRGCLYSTADTADCEHLIWRDGEMILINERNEILAEHPDVDFSNINWYSMIVNQPSVDTGIYMSIKGTDGLTYSFIDYKKEFEQWLNHTFIPALKDENKLQDMLFKEVTFRSQNKGWSDLNKKEFLKKFPEVLTRKLFEPEERKTVVVAQLDLNMFIFTKNIYNKYFNACGAFNRYRYPSFEVLITYYREKQKPLSQKKVKDFKYGKIDHQEYVQFLRTDNGYKLLSLSSPES